MVCVWIIFNYVFGQIKEDSQEDKSNLIIKRSNNQTFYPGFGFLTMQQTIYIDGMSCEGCAAKIKYLLSQIDDCQVIHVDFKTGEVVLDSVKTITEEDIKKVLVGNDRYSLKQNKNKRIQLFMRWWKTYQPVLLIALYLLIGTFGLQLTRDKWNSQVWMQEFMAGFFLVFSFFKLLNLKGFAMSYSAYDLIAKKWTAWGYIYPFVELIFGFFYLFKIQSDFLDIACLIIMVISLLGVLKSVLSNKKIQCACLGTVFNLPMSTISIIEDATMIVMSLLLLLF